MTIEELKDLIDSTINENGTKAITGKALNLALNEITNAVAEAATTGGGGGVKRLYVDISGGTLTDPEQLASNAALYTEIVTALTNNELPPQVGVLISEGGGYTNAVFNFITYGDSVITFMLSMGSSQTIMALTSDGNVSMGG